MRGEEIGDYKWALKEIENLFFGQQIPPEIVTDSEGALADAIQEVAHHSRHLLCLWHIEKNVLANIKNHIVNGDEHKAFMMSSASVCRANTPAQFEMLKDTLFTQLSHVPAVIKYLTDTWLPHKKKNVSAWTNNCRYFGNTSTSAAEGVHATLNRYHQVSTGDLHAV
ncbi:hypothetical protein PsorP6_010721 [Peronosclerospora sorghi]|uniref:Uncharacterized protein n=1 Tax=Peronosclerospora sorghi TaxID=230839 RepID=A0ACC0VUJ4_9STRA|nr:hypothetical protein PsorP6_010721 [Peronosclerospora sorghi]